MFRKIHNPCTCSLMYSQILFCDMLKCISYILYCSPGHDHNYHLMHDYIMGTLKITVSLFHSPNQLSVTPSSHRPPSVSSCLPGCGSLTHHLCGSTGTCSSSDYHQTEEVDGREGAQWPISLIQPDRRRGGEDY